MMRNRLYPYLQKIVRSVKNWGFARESRDARSKKFLYSCQKNSRTSWVEWYQKAQRGWYLRPFYGSLNIDKNKFPLVFGILGIFLIVTTLSIVFYSSYFKISPNRLIIERIDDYSDINIAYRAIEPLYGRSLWSTSTAEVQELITHLQKNITHVTLERIYPNSIRILLESSPLVYSVIFPGTNKNYELSKNGILIPNKGAVSRLPRLQIYSPELFESSFLDYKQAVDINTMNAINSILAILKSDFKVSEVGSLLLYSVENELHVLMQNKNRLIFVLDSTLDKQLLWLKFAVDNTPGLLTEWALSYIDTRSIGKIFICRDPTLCQKNILKSYGPPLY